MTEYVVEFGKAGTPPEPDGRLDAAAFHRNHAAIWSVLDGFLRDQTGDVLEIGSGTGQHIVAFAQGAPDTVWWPSDYNDAHLKSIGAWRAHAQLANLRAPQHIDLLSRDWSSAVSEDSPGPLLAMVCINVLHIAPWKASESLLRGAGRLLRPDGRLFLYGPFMRGGMHIAPSNAAFDMSLRRGNPEWGVRDTDDLAALAERESLQLAHVIDMPANNMILVFERTR